jgi:hypothetical protein
VGGSTKLSRTFQAEDHRNTMKAATVMLTTLLTAASQGANAGQQPTLAKADEGKVSRVIDTAQNNVIARTKATGDHKSHGCKPENLVFRRE